MACMDAAAIALCEEAAGAQFAYVQSDEISLLLTDFADINTEAWFDNCQNKIESVSASIVTSAFNLAVMGKLTSKRPTAVFDARAFVIPDHIEVENYFIDRQQDAVRNSVMMLARAYASHKELMGKNQSAQHEIIHAAGDNWEKHPARFRHGSVIRRSAVDYLAQPQSPPGTHPAYFRQETVDDLNLMDDIRKFPQSNWFVDEGTPVFTRARHYLRAMIPIHWENDMVERIPDHRKGT